VRFRSQLLVEISKRADQSFELGNANVGVGLGLLNLFAKLLDLVAKRVEERAKFLLIAFGKGLRFFVEDFSGEGLELVGKVFFCAFEQRDLLCQALPLSF